MSVAIVWLRGLLRLHDNPVLNWACSNDEIDSIVPIFIIEEFDDERGNPVVGDNRMRFLYESILDLDKGLKEQYDSTILVFSGNPRDVITSIVQSLDSDVKLLLTDYRSEPKMRVEISDIEKLLKPSGLETIVFPAVSTILDIEEVTRSQTYKNPKSSRDIDAIMREYLDEGPEGYMVSEPSPKPVEVRSDSRTLDTLVSYAGTSDYHIEMDEVRRRASKIEGHGYFPGGESEALERLRRKVVGMPDYVNKFSKPDTFSTNENQNPLEPTTTGLSPYISTGCLSVRLVWNEVVRANLHSEHTKPPQSLLGQLMFREMFYLLSRSVENWDDDIDNSNCKRIEWGSYDEVLMTAWESGMTGYPYIDAMMRQLDTTGWMHHLGRHAVSCFLTRGQLWQNWKHGRDVFERKLIDSDWALNNGNWLWLAGVAPFSMPYYRVYNPCPDARSSLNVETRDAAFIRHWVPELSTFPSRYIFEPHLAPIEIQRSSKCIIGEDYPEPIVDRNEARKRNMALFKESLENLS